MARAVLLTTLHSEGKAVRDPSVTFSRGSLGTSVTLRLINSSELAIVEALLGPGGQIPLRSPAGDHVLSVVAWNPTKKTLELSVAPRS